MRHTTALAGLILTLGVALAPAAQAGAQTPGCVSPREFEQVAGKDWTVTRVHRIFETRGAMVLKDGGAAVRNYRACGRGPVVSVYYERQERPERRYRMAGLWKNTRPPRILR